MKTAEAMTDPIDTIVVGRHDWPNPPSENTVDLPVLRGLQQRLGGRMLVVVGTSSGRLSLWRHGDLEIVQLPMRRRTSFLRDVYRLSEAAIARSTAGTVFVASDVWGGLVGTRISRRTCVPFVMQVQGDILSPGPEYGSGMKRLLLSRAARVGVRSAAAVRCLNTQIERSVLEVAPRAHTAVLGSRVDVELFRYRGADRQTSLDGPVITCVGTLSELKNQHLLIEALRACADELPHARLQLIGTGESEGNLRAITKRQGLDDRVDFRAHVPNQELPGLLAASDIFAFPSQSEGQPRAVLEALAVGLPVVASDIPAHEGVVIDGATGLVRPTNDPDAWASAFIDLAGQPELRSRLSSAGRELVQAHHAFEPQLDRFAELIRRVASRTGRGERFGR